MADKMIGLGVFSRGGWDNTEYAVIRVEIERQDNLKWPPYPEAVERHIQLLSKKQPELSFLLDRVEAPSRKGLGKTTTRPAWHHEKTMVVPEVSVETIKKDLKRNKPDAQVDFYPSEDANYQTVDTKESTMSEDLEKLMLYAGVKQKAKHNQLDEGGCPCCSGPCHCSSDCAKCGGCSMNESVAEDTLGTDPMGGHGDHEISLASSQLKRMLEHGQELLTMVEQIPEDHGLQAWMQMKLTRASDAIDAVYHRLSYDMSSDSQNVQTPAVTPDMPLNMGESKGDMTRLMIEMIVDEMKKGKKAQQISEELSFNFDDVEKVVVMVQDKMDAKTADVVEPIAPEEPEMDMVDLGQDDVEDQDQTLMMSEGAKKVRITYCDDYRVPAPSGKESEAYYTDDYQDACDTAKKMYGDQEIDCYKKTVHQHPGQKNESLAEAQEFPYKVGDKVMIKGEKYTLSHDEENDTWMAHGSDGEEMEVTPSMIDKKVDEQINESADLTRLRKLSGL